MYRKQSVHSITEMLSASLRHNIDDADVDWSKQKNKDRVRDLCTLIRSLFWAFQEVERLGGTDGKVAPQGLRVFVRRVVRTEAFSLFFLLLTAYALFGPDAAMAMGHTAQNADDHTLAAINTVVLVLFLMEQGIFCLSVNGYPCSGRFWTDTFATLSIVGDTFIGNELVKSDAAVAGRASRLIRLVRLGGRSTRLVRLMRLARVAQVLRLVPKVQEYLESSTKHLAVLLWHKRMRHVFQFLDKSGSGILTGMDINFLNRALLMEFSGSKEDQIDTRPISAKIARACSLRTFSVTVLPDVQIIGEATFSEFAPCLFRSEAGKKAFNRCLDDIHCMKESCAMVESAISRLTLKVCILVLMLLIMMQVLDIDEGDLTQIQGLHQLDAVALDQKANVDIICSMVLNDYSKVPALATLLLLVLDSRAYWSSDCRCQPGCAGGGPALEDGGWALADEAIRVQGHESHEYSIHEVWSADGEKVRSLAVFDVHEWQRAGALLSMAQTAVIVVLLLCLVAYFATDMKRLSNNNVLHPLWDLMDDMCALKSIEVVGEARFPEDDIETLVGMYLPRRSRCFQWRCRQHIPAADELVQLRRAFDKLRMAMFSWSKFVPVVLLKQLFQAGVEAKIGCSHCEASVFFCDIDDFKELCEGSKPREVLHLLELVLSHIYEALAENGGTLLEFIGDEVLAVFNAPCPVALHPLCAVTAALDAQERLDKQPGLPVRLRCSVHKARVLAGNIGSPSRMKYGALGDGVNLAARLKSLNTRYGTHLLVSCDALDFLNAHDTFVTRPIGKLVLKGRTTPTLTFEVLGKRNSAPPHVADAAEKHRKAFELFLTRHFAEAKALFDEVSSTMSVPAATAYSESLGAASVDRPSEHLSSLCQKYLVSPPLDGWDGSEHLKKKAW